MFDWIKRTFGRGSRVDQLIRALPNPDRLVAGADAWGATILAWGDKIEAWEPQESKLIDVIRSTADALDLLGPMLGGRGDEKREALKAALRNAASSAGIADEAYDLAWRQKFRPLLEAYIARLRG